MRKHKAADRTRAAAPERRLPSLRRLGRIVLLLACLPVIVSIVAVALYRVIPPPATPLMLIRAVQGHGLAKSWRPLGDISPNLVRAVIAGEDARFCRHYGFDWRAIEAAWERYESGRGRLLGASTISMQTAKNLFLWPGRDWLRKGLEAWFTVWIELAWSKRRIIETYLNIVEWDSGIYGAEAAARHYFGKKAAELTALEAARLAAVLPDPLDRSARSPSPGVRRRAASILRQMSQVPVRQPLPCGSPL